MAESKRQLLTIGIFCIILVVAILLLAANVITLGLVVPLILGLFGLWILVMAVMRGATPVKYERGAFSTMAMGVGLIVVGAAWYLFSYGFWLYGLALIVLALGAIAIAAAMRRK
jgi:hypothetical protein